MPENIDGTSKTPGDDNTIKKMSSELLTGGLILGDDLTTKNPTSVAKDLKITGSNKIEKGVFVRVYAENIKMNIDGKEISFKEIRQMDPKSMADMLEKMTDEQYSIFQNYNEKNEKESLDDTLRKSIFNQIEELKKLNSQALSLIDQKGKDLIETDLQSIKSDPTKSPIAQDLIQRGQATEASIRDGTSDAVLKTHIIIDRAPELSPTDPDKAKELSDIIRQMRESTGLPATSESLKAVFDSHVMGPNRPSLELAAHEMLSSGKYERIRWDNDNRLLIFEGRGNTQVIDTLREPPARMIIRNGLSISRDISYSPDDINKIKGRDEEQSRLNKGTRALEDTSAIFWNGRRSEYSTPDTYSTYVRENRRLHDQYETLEGQYARGEVEPENRVETLEKMASLTREMRADNMNRILEKGDTTTGGAISELLERRGERLSGMIHAEKQLQSIDQTKLNPKLSSDTNGNWEDIANNNLAWLTERGFDRLGSRSQMILDQILETINADRDKSNQISLNTPISGSRMGSDRILDMSLSKLGGTREMLTSDRIGDLQKNLTEASLLSPDHPQSIYSRLRGIPKAEPKVTIQNTGGESSGSATDLA